MWTMSSTPRGPINSNLIERIYSGRYRGRIPSRMQWKVNLFGIIQYNVFVANNDFNKRLIQNTNPKLESHLDGVSFS